MNGDKDEAPPPWAAHDPIDAELVTPGRATSASRWPLRVAFLSWIPGFGGLLAGFLLAGTGPRSLNYTIMAPALSALVVGVLIGLFAGYAGRNRRDQLATGVALGGAGLCFVALLGLLVVTASR